MKKLSGFLKIKPVFISAFKNWAIRKIGFYLITGFVVFLIFQSDVYAQKLDVAYVPTPDVVVERMLEMANVGPGDYVIDLGCGDGRIVIAAAKRGAFGHGVDIDPQRIEEAQKNAEKAGVTDKVIFVEENIYDTDFSRANVITMYLFPSINIKLRPSLLKNLEPGSRIVSHDFNMDEWKADKQHGRMEEHAIHFWIVPAQVEGAWSWKNDGKEFIMSAGQKFQKLELSILSEGEILNVENSLLSGKRICFTVTNPSDQKKYIYSGQVNKNEISGIVQIHDGKNKSVENWTAVQK